MNKYTPYPNGPFTHLFGFLFELLKFWKWKYMSISWIRYSIRQFIHGENYTLNDFHLFMKRFHKYEHWFEEYGYKKSKKS